MLCTFWVVFTLPTYSAHLTRNLLEWLFHSMHHICMSTHNHHIHYLQYNYRSTHEVTHTHIHTLTSGASQPIAARSAAFTHSHIHTRSHKLHILYHALFRISNVVVVVILIVRAWWFNITPACAWYMCTCVLCCIWPLLFERLEARRRSTPSKQHVTKELPPPLDTASQDTNTLITYTHTLTHGVR